MNVAKEYTVSKDNPFCLQPLGVWSVCPCGFLCGSVNGRRPLDSGEHEPRPRHHFCFHLFPGFTSSPTLCCLGGGAGGAEEETHVATCSIPTLYFISSDSHNWSLNGRRRGRKRGRRRKTVSKYINERNVKIFTENNSFCLMKRNSIVYKTVHGERRQAGTRDAIEM